MRFSSERLENAVNLARTQGHRVALNSACIGQDGELRLTVDGYSQPVSELYRMVEPADKDIFGFEADGYQHEIHVCYLDDGQTVYQIYQAGENRGEPQPLTENVIDFVQRITENMGGNSLRRLL